MQFQVRPPPPPPPPGEGGRGALRGFCLVLYKTRRVTLAQTYTIWFGQTTGSVKQNSPGHIGTNQFD
jgi:hypothetical protein